VTTPATHPGNDYYVNSFTHTIQRQSNPIAAAALTASGWVGPYTWAEAKTAAAHTGPTLPLVPGGGGQTFGPGGPNLGGIAAVGDFFNRLTQANTWIRVGEVLAGLLLLYIGVNALMRGTAAESAVNTAKQGAKRTAEVVGAVAK